MKFFSHLSTLFCLAHPSEYLINVLDRVRITERLYFQPLSGFANKTAFQICLSKRILAVTFALQKSLPSLAFHIKHKIASKLLFQHLKNFLILLILLPTCSFPLTLHSNNFPVSYFHVLLF